MNPNITPGKEIPEVNITETESPKISRLKHINPPQTPGLENNPNQTPGLEDNPNITDQLQDPPEPKALDKEMPTPYKEENCVTIKGKKIEIQPTKLAYFRNKTASAYEILKAVPLTEFMTVGKGVFDEKRDADQILFDFLIAVFDDKELLKTSYDDITAADVEKILEIFGRINGIEARKEEARKNREAQGKH